MSKTLHKSIESHWASYTPGPMLSNEYKTPVLKNHCLDTLNANLIEHPVSQRPSNFIHSSHLLSIFHLSLLFSQHSGQFTWAGYIQCGFYKCTLWIAESSVSRCFLHSMVINSSCFHQASVGNHKSSLDRASRLSSIFCWLAFSLLFCSHWMAT